MQAHEGLRKALSVAVSVYAEPETTPARVEQVLAILPQHAPAVLALLGEVREGYEVQWDDGVAYGEHYVQFSNVPDAMRQYVSPVLVMSLGAAAKEAGS